MATVSARRGITLILGAVILCTLMYNTQIAAAPNLSARYRLQTTTSLDRDDAKLVKVRVESVAEFCATVTHGEGHTSCYSTLDPTSKLHSVEIVMLIDHIPSRQCVKELLTVGAAGGPSVQSVTEDFTLNDNFEAGVISGNHERDESVDLFGWQGRTFTLTIGK